MLGLKLNHVSKRGPRWHIPKWKCHMLTTFSSRAETEVAILMQFSSLVAHEMVMMTKFRDWSQRKLSSQQIPVPLVSKTSSSLQYFRFTLSKVLFAFVYVVILPVTAEAMWMIRSYLSRLLQCLCTAWMNRTRVEGNNSDMGNISMD